MLPSDSFFVCLKNDRFIVIILSSVETSMGLVIKISSRVKLLVYKSNLKDFSKLQ